MGKYCDNKELERTWVRWSFARRTPELELLRESNVLWTRVSGNKSDHLIVSIEPFNFCLENDQRIPQETIAAAFKSSLLQVASGASQEESLLKNGYYRDTPIEMYWDRLASMIYSICSGLSLKFHLMDADERSELAHEALFNTLSKLERGKLNFTPRKAPAFNLLTTAIYRIMCSIKNKDKRCRNNRTQLAEDLYNDVSLPNLRSIVAAKNSAFTTHGEQE